MAVIDASVWIAFLKGEGNDVFFEQAKHIIRLISSQERIRLPAIALFWTNLSMSPFLPSEHAPH